MSALLEALLIVFFWIFIGAQLPKLLNRRADTNRKLISLIGILLAVVIGMGLTFAFRAGNEESWNEEAAPAMTAASLRLLNSFSEIPASYGKRARGADNVYGLSFPIPIP